MSSTSSCQQYWPSALIVPLQPDITQCPPQCQNGASCQPSSGKCDCRPGWRGIYCDTPCPAGTWGQDCARECHCTNNGVCDHGKDIVSILDVKELFLVMTSHYNLCLPLTPLWSLRPPVERKFSILMTEVCSAQCRASVSVLRASRASTVRRFATRTSSVSGAPTPATVILSTARAVTTSRANVSVARDGEVSELTTTGPAMRGRPNNIFCLQE